MDLKILQHSTSLATPAVSLQDFTAELAISFRIKPQAWPFGSDPSQGAHLNVLKELLPLRHRKAEYQPSEGRQKSILVAGLQAHSRQKIRADHLQAIASRFVAPEHQSRCFERLLDHRQLALVGLEIEDLPRLRFLARSGASTTSRLNSSLGSSLALCNQVAQSNP